jgi:transcriptional regulator GlxA family with amidase domain
MSPKTQTAINLMQINLHRSVRVSELARSVRLSRSRLYYLFKAEVGMSPVQYLKSLRMQKARSLLETPLLNVKEIAAIAGYNDGSHFMRDFKKTYGITPSQYRAGYISVIPTRGSLTFQNRKLS